ncbi:hypothetical protein TNCT_625001 [Trichonephila clavata]|uniref:Mos1 transposase HTH domain-containing protein n=1 Tax=Trichonephila clavata TaxID=2740835 RepID=A0A8X6KEH0_TRICU|nr:hypothetical protein TNCT_625001 [Trichonephila clavata]
MEASERCQRDVGKFLTAENGNFSEIYRRIQNVYLTEDKNCRSVFRWCRYFRSGRSSTNDRSRPGQANVAITEEAVAEMDPLVRIYL